MIEQFNRRLRGWTRLFFNSLHALRGVLELDLARIGAIPGGTFATVCLVYTGTGVWTAGVPLSLRR